MTVWLAGPAYVLSASRDGLRQPPFTNIRDADKNRYFPAERQNQKKNNSTSRLTTLKPVISDVVMGRSPLWGNGVRDAGVKQDLHGLYVWGKPASTVIEWSLEPLPAGNEDHEAP